MDFKEIIYSQKTKIKIKEQPCTLTKRQKPQGILHGLQIVHNQGLQLRNPTTYLRGVNETIFFNVPLINSCRGCLLINYNLT